MTDYDHKNCYLRGAANAGVLAGAGIGPRAPFDARPIAEAMTAGARGVSPGAVRDRMEAAVKSEKLLAEQLEAREMAFSAVSLRPGVLGAVAAAAQFLPAALGLASPVLRLRLAAAGRRARMLEEQVRDMDALSARHEQALLAQYEDFKRRAAALAAATSTGGS